MLLADWRYAVTVLTGLVLCLIWFALTLKRRGMRAILALPCGGLGILAGYLCAKLVYLAFNFGPMFGAYGGAALFRLEPEEFSFMGGGAGFCLGVWLGARVMGERPSLVLDAFAAPGCLLAAALRFAEIFAGNGEIALADLYTVGLPEIEEGTVFAFFPASLQDPYGMWHFAVSTLTALCALLIALHTVLRARRFAAVPGLSFERAAFLLSAVQLYLELTRLVSLIFFFVHVEQVLAALIMLFLMIHACRRVRRMGGGFPVWPLAGTVLCIAVNGVTQYLMDKPWKFERLMPETMFYWINDNLTVFGNVVMLATAVAMPLLHAWVIHRTLQLANRNRAK